MNKEKIDNYYKIMVEIRKNNKDGRALFAWEKEAINKGLDNLLNRNYEHMLTPSYLNYLGSSSIIGFDFEKLASDVNGIIFAVTFYFKSLSQQYYLAKMNKKNSFDYVKLIDENVEKSLLNLRYFEEKTNFRYQINAVFECLLAYCYMNNQLDKFTDYCSLALKNDNEITDHLTINCIFDGPDCWYDYINNVVNEWQYGKRKVIK